MIVFNGNGEVYNGYMAVPESGRGPAVVVIQEWWGLVDHIKDVVDRLAAEGFVAMAPDLYKGESTTEPEEAGTLAMALQIPEVRKMLSGAADKLIQLEEVTSEKAGVVGFCLGGALALYAAAVEPDRYGCCVNFYGIQLPIDTPYENLSGPVLGLFAEIDEYTGPAEVQALDYKLNKLDKPHEFVTYPGTHHAFFNDDRPEVYNAEASADAWKGTIVFLRANAT